MERQASPLEHPGEDFPDFTLLGSEAKFTEGSVSSLSGPGGDASFLQISVPVHAGNSGGALLNDAGEVVGVVIATASAPAFFRATGNLPQNINWAVKGAYATMLFDALPRVLAGGDRGEIIKRTMKATCRVVAEVGEK